MPEKNEIISVARHSEWRMARSTENLTVSEKKVTNYKLQ